MGGGGGEEEGGRGVDGNAGGVEVEAEAVAVALLRSPPSETTKVSYDCHSLDDRQIKNAWFEVA